MKILCLIFIISENALLMARWEGGGGGGGYRGKIGQSSELNNQYHTLRLS